MINNSIKTQIVILRNILNTALYVQWAYYNFSNTFNWHLTTLMSITTNKIMTKKIFCKLFRIIKFFFLIHLRKATLESKVAPTNRNNSAFLLHTNKCFSNIELFFIFSQTFLKLIFATKMLLKQSAVLFTSWQKKYCVYYVPEHLKYCTQINDNNLIKMPVWA